LAVERVLLRIGGGHPPVQVHNAPRDLPVRADEPAVENDDFVWPHRDGLIWPHFSSVVVGLDVA
jgi:hypothetical protein